MYQKQINVNLADSCPLDFAAALEASQRSVGTPPGPTNPTTITNYKHNSQCEARINDLTWQHRCSRGSWSWGRLWAFGFIQCFIIHCLLTAGACIERHLYAVGISTLEAPWSRVANYLVEMISEEKYTDTTKFHDTSNNINWWCSEISQIS